MPFELPKDRNNVNYFGTTDRNNENLGQFMYGLDESGNPRIVRTDEEGNVLTRVTGSNIEEIYVQDEDIIINPGETFRMIDHKAIDFELVNEVIIAMQASSLDDLEVRYYNTVYKGNGNLFREPFTSEDSIFRVLANRVIFTSEVFSDKMTVEVRNTGTESIDITQASILGRRNK